MLTLTWKRTCYSHHGDDKKETYRGPNNKLWKQQRFEPRTVHIPGRWLFYEFQLVKIHPGLWDCTWAGRLRCCLRISVRLEKVAYCLKDSEKEPFLSDAWNQEGAPFPQKWVFLPHSQPNVYTFFKTELKYPILCKVILLPSLILLEDIIALLFVTFILYYINSFK